MTPAAQWIWDRAALLQFLAFPWRMLEPAALALAALIAALAGALEHGPAGKTAFAAAMIVLIAPNLSHSQAGHYREIDPESWTPEQIAQRGLEVTTYAEYRPVWMETVPPYRPLPVIASGIAAIQQTGRSPEAWSGIINATTPATAELSLAYFPTWRLRMDGKEINAFPAENSGLLRFNVPPGRHVVSAVWTRTPMMWAADGMSVLALCILIALAAPERRRAAAEKAVPAPVPQT
jgi:hypothetical protein